MTHNHNRMDLPRLVVDRILLHLTDVDALYSVHMARETLTTVIDMCPPEWRRELHAEFLCRVKPPPRQDPGFSVKNSTRYLVPQSVAGKIANKHKGKRVSRLRLTAMRKWLLEQHGSAVAWKAAQIVSLSKKSRCVWTAESLMEVMPSVVHLLAKNLDVPESFLRRLQIFDEPMQMALLDGEATPAATKRLLDFMLSTDFPGKDECILLQRHVLSGDDAVQREYMNLAIGKLATLSEDAAGMKELLEELSPDRADVMTAFAKELGTYHSILQDQHDVIVDYIRGAETWSAETRLALLDQIRVRSNEVEWQRVRDELEEAGISEEDEEHASSWLYKSCMPWISEEPDFFISTIKHYMAFEDSLADDDIEPVVTTDGQADIVCDGVGLRQLSDDTWDEVGRLISSDHDFDGAAELCQYVFFQFSELRAALQACGLEYRHDSELCRAYVERGDGDLDRIVGTMKEMDFFVKSTEYSAIVSTLRDRRNHYRMTAHAESALAKKVALLSHTGEPPEFLRALADDAVALQDANGIYEKIRATEPCSGRWNMCADCRDAYDISDSDESDDSSRDW